MIEPTKPQPWGEFQASIQEIFTQSDRAVAIVSAAVLDELLTRVLAAYFVDDAACRDSLLGAGDSALGSLSARIDVAYMLNLIEPWERKDLHTIRRIRNDFAHKLEMRNFAEPSIKDRIRNLEAFDRSQPPFPASDLSPRDQFIFSGQFHIARLNKLSETTRRVNAPLTHTG